MYVEKYIIEQNIMLGETYLVGQNWWPVTSQVVYTLFMETAANYWSVYSGYAIYFQQIQTPRSQFKRRNKFGLTRHKNIPH